jgi:hypothetical protein
MSVPLRGVAGAIGLVGSEALLFAGNRFVGQFFTPLVWTSYIFLVDGMLERVSGTSPMRRAPLHVLWTALASIAIWYVFEAYNLRMRGWIYTGLPEDPIVRIAGYFWAFATIGPGLFLTRELIQVLLARRGPGRAAGTGASRAIARNGALPRALAGASIAVGALCLFAPFLVTPSAARYLWAPVWAGFIFLVDPLNARMGRGSIWHDLLARDGRRIVSLLLAGLVCGGLWEMWNYWATTRWVYTFPFAGLERFKLFEMPLVGFVGFPPFAIEYYALTELLARLWKGNADLDAPGFREAR